MKNIKGVIFDYGGTIDTNGVHWSEVLWSACVKEHIDVTKQQFRECYVLAERKLSDSQQIKPEHNFLDVLRMKTDIETSLLYEKGYWHTSELTRRTCAEHVALRCYQQVVENLRVSRDVVDAVSRKCPTVLVTNFYGNIQSVLRDFRIKLFRDVIESAAVGVRKPDPAIFRLGIKSLGLAPEEVAVVGDSFRNDVVPARSIGCHAVWLKGTGWDDHESFDESVPTSIISDIQKLPAILFG